MFCPQCGNNLMEADNFCGRCGLKKLDFVVQNDQRVQGNPTITTPSKLNHQKNQSRAVDNLSLNWFKFYTYILIPLAVLNQLLRLGDNTVSGIITILILAPLVYGLHKRRIWAWWLNMIVQAVQIASFLLIPGMIWTTDVATRALACFVIVLFWGIPMAWYFMKRKHLFI